jgi:colanic acid/amylovoran biosynthesis protein
VTVLERLPAPAGAGARLRIGLLWHSLTSGNLGVGALTLANMAIADRVAREAGLVPQFTIMGMRDDDNPRLADASVMNVVIDSKAMIPPVGFWKAAGEVDCVLDIGAGDSFAEIYGAKRFAFLWGTKLMLIMRGVPLLLSPQTIGPFEKPVYRRLAAIVLKRAFAVVARDTLSLDVTQRIAPDAHALLSIDVAFELPYHSRAAERGGPRLRVGINASGLLFHEAETGRNRFGLQINYADFTRRLIAALIDRGVEVHLVTHAISGGDATDDDGKRADLLAAEFPSTIRVPEFAGPSEAKAYLSSLDFLVAARMHACIGAFSAGTPIVAVAYSRKFSGLFGLLDYRWLLPVTGMDDDEALAFVLDALDRRAELASDAAIGMTKVSGLLGAYYAELRRLFAAVAK